MILQCRIGVVAFLDAGLLMPAYSVFCYIDVGSCRAKMRYQSPTTRRLIRFALFVAIWIVLRGIYTWHQSRFVETNVPRLDEAVYQVEQVEDNFELLISRLQQAKKTEKARVRLIGVARPWQWERDEQWSVRAKSAIQSWIDQDGKGEIQLRLGRRQIDQDGCFLAYAYVGEELINERLIREGLAVIDAQADPSSSLLRRMVKSDKLAREQAVGIWSARAMGLLDTHPSTNRRTGH